MEKESSTTEKVMVSGFTARSLITGLALVVVFSVVAIFFKGFYGGTFGINLYLVYMPEVMNLFVITTLSLFVLVAISSFLKERGYTAQELTVIYTMMISSLFVAFWWDFFAIGLSVGALLPYSLGAMFRDKVLPIQSPLFGPKDAAIINGMLRGGVPVPWGDWMPGIAFWMAFLFSWTAFSTGMTLILSRQLIETEALPFPMTTALMQIIDEPQKPLKQRSGIKLIGIMFVVGFVAQSFFDLLNAINPSISKPAFWYDLGGISGLNQYNIFMQLTFSALPLWVGIWLLVPTDFMWSSLLSMVVFGMIIPAIETSMGLLRPKVITGWTSWIGILFTSQNFLGTLQANVVLHLGMPMGIALAYLLITRKGWIDSFKSALAGGKTGPFSSRLCWALFLGGFIIFAALILAAQVPVAPTVFILTYTILLQYINVRVRGEAIGQPHLGWNGVEYQWNTSFATYDMAIEAAGGRGPLAPNLAGSYNTSFINWYVCGNLLTYPALSVGLAEGFKLSNLTKTEWKGVAIASGIALVVAVVIGFPFHLWGPYTLGYIGKWPSQFPVWGGNWGAFWISNCSVNPTSYMTTDASSFTKPWLWVGIVVGIILTILRFRFAWFALNPLGVIYGMSWFFLAFFWTQMLIALIIKVLALKIGGSKFYSEKIVPSALGLIMGSGLCGIVYAIVMIAKVSL